MKAGLKSYRYDRRMPGESMFESETGLMNYRNDRCMSGESKMFEIEAD